MKLEIIIYPIAEENRWFFVDTAVKLVIHLSLVLEHTVI
jgi:hypothetical protein